MESLAGWEAEKEKEKQEDVKAEEERKKEEEEVKLAWWTGELQTWWKKETGVKADQSFLIVGFGTYVIIICFRALCALWPSNEWNGRKNASWYNAF